MATKLPKETLVACAGRGPKHNWTEWFDGGVWLIKRGEDYHCTDTSFRATCYGTARRKGIRVRVVPVDDGFEVQAYREDGQPIENGAN